MGLAASWVLSVIPGLIAAICYGMLNVNRATHDATRSALDAQRRLAEVAVAVVVAVAPAIQTSTR